jgi:hypothetical protein
MNINSTIFSHCHFSLFSDHLIPSLIAKHKKIMVVAAISLGFLAACCYAIHHCLLRFTKKSRVDNSKATPTAVFIKTLQEIWQSKIRESFLLNEFQRNWKNWVVSEKQCAQESRKLQTLYQNSCYHTKQINLNSYDAPLGAIYGVPNNFSMWMPGVALIASHLTEKKNIEGLFVCQTLEAFSTRLIEIAESNENQRCAFIIGTLQPGFNHIYGFERNFPQHKVTVCVEKKEGELTIVLLDSEPIPHLNQIIDPKNLSDDIWKDFDEFNKFNNQELAFRAILKACRQTKTPTRLLHSQVLREKAYGCEVFALQDALSYLRDPDFFKRITCSEEIVKIDQQYQIEIITQLPPEYMIGLQSFKLLKDYKLKVGQSVFDQPIVGKKKTFQNYLDENLLPVTIGDKQKSQNHYITKKSFKFLTILIEYLNNLKPDEFKQVVGKTLVTKIDKDLFPDTITSRKVLESVQESCQMKGDKPPKLVV